MTHITHTLKAGEVNTAAYVSKELINNHNCMKENNGVESASIVFMSETSAIFKRIKER